MASLPLLASANPLPFVILCLVLGLVVGSFLNVVIHRLPKMMERDWRRQCVELEGREAPAEPRYNLWTPASACPACGAPVTALRNIPLISYVLLGGRCAACRAPISLRYPVVELLSGILAAYAGWRYGATWATLGVACFALALVTLTCIDLDTQLLPDSITLPLLWLGLLFNVGGTFADLPAAVWGAAAGYLSLWGVYWLFKLATGKEGMGYGDFKLLAAIGAWLGWQMLPLVILLSSAAGAVVGITLMIFGGRHRDTPLPFGPYLATGGVIGMFWGASWMAAYLRWGVAG